MTPAPTPGTKPTSSHDRGWYVEIEGRRLAVLTDVQYHDLFWESYRLVPLTTDSAEVAMLFSEEFWDRFSRITFRSRQSGDVALHAFPSQLVGTELKQSGRVVMRGLYMVPPNNLWGWLLHWLRRFCFLFTSRGRQDA